MKLMRSVRLATSAAAVMLIGFAGMWITSPRVHADSNESDPRVQIGFDISPVKLNLTGLNRALVGIGSYIVNGPGDCSGCHNAPDIGPRFLPGGNPFFGQPMKINPASYLGGGTTFNFPVTGGVIQSRNLTPDKTGLPEGGHTLEEFITILRTGKDFDHIHPPCPTVGTDGCISPTVGDGDLLQIMPWPFFGNLSDYDLRAIYEFLKAIPCIAHTPGTPGLLPGVYNTCN